MKIAIHVSERVGHTWPPTYWMEFIRKCADKGHDIHVFSGESNVRMDMKTDKLFDHTQLPYTDAAIEVAKCDLFVGPLLGFYRVAKDSGVKTVGILMSSVDGEGVKATIPCVGCKESIGERPDCHWEDELCQWHVTPNDVLKAAGL